MRLHYCCEYGSIFNNLRTETPMNSIFGAGGDRPINALISRRIGTSECTRMRTWLKAFEQCHLRSSYMVDSWGIPIFMTHQAGRPEKAEEVDRITEFRRKVRGSKLMWDRRVNEMHSGSTWKCHWWSILYRLSNGYRYRRRLNFDGLVRNPRRVNKAQSESARNCLAGW